MSSGAEEARFCFCARGFPRGGEWRLYYRSVMDKGDTNSGDIQTNSTGVEAFAGGDRTGVARGGHQTPRGLQRGHGTGRLPWLNRGEPPSPATIGFALSFALCCAGLAWSCAAPETTERPAEAGEAAPSKLNEAPPDEGGVLSAGIIGSKHDFTQEGMHARDLCTPCHTPHLPEGKPPLLDRRTAATAAIRPFEAVAVELDDASLLCLSCHDGVIASDVYTAAHATRLSSQLGTSQLGTGPLTGHPIGVEYPTTDPTYRPMDAVMANGRIILPDGRVQCISCHDPHNTGRHEGMLVTSNRGSRLCLACHRL